MSHDNYRILENSRSAFGIVAVRCQDAAGRILHISGWAFSIHRTGRAVRPASDLFRELPAFHIALTYPGRGTDDLSERYGLSNYSLISRRIKAFIVVKHKFGPESFTRARLTDARRNERQKCTDRFLLFAEWAVARRNARRALATAVIACSWL